MLEFAVVDKILCYSPANGLLWYKTAVGGHRKGDLAGYRIAGEKAVVTIAGKTYQSSSIAYLLTHGQWPTSLLVQHKNGDRSDLRLDNLEWITYAEKIKRQADLANKKYPGVGQRRKGGRWEAKIKIGYDSIQLGTFDTFEEAVEARQAADNAPTVRGLRKQR